MKVGLMCILALFTSICFADNYVPPLCMVDNYDVPIINTAHYVFPSGKTKDSFVAESFFGENKKPIIMYNGNELLKHFSPETVTFIIRHECQHIMLGHVKPEGTLIPAGEHRRHELEADCEAAKDLLSIEHFTNKQLLNVIEDVTAFKGSPPGGRSGEEISEIIQICTSHFTNIDGCGMQVTQDQLNQLGRDLGNVDKLDTIMK